MKGKPRGRSDGPRLYQVVYCVMTRHSGPWWLNHYLLQCPLIGIKDLDEARRRAKEWKALLGVRFQPIIIGETFADYEHIGIDCLYGVKAINGFNASEMEFPDFLLEEDEESDVAHEK